MARSLLCLAPIFFLHVASLHGQNPTSDDAFHNALVLQRAMEQARHCLLQSKSKEAVDILEGQLPRVNGNAAYLRILRDAYRQHIKDLCLANQPAQARRYLERLCILEPAAANDPTLRPPEPAPRKEPVGNAAPRQYLPRFVPSILTQGISKPAAADSSKPSAVRAKGEDPFDLTNQRGGLALADKGKASQLLSQAETEFSRRRFAEARTLYEQAFQADQKTVEPAKDRWAYCLLSTVVQKLNQPGLGGESPAELEKQVHGAVAMAPALADTGKWLLREIDERGKKQPASAPEPDAEPLLQIQHFGKSAQGWQVAETNNFRIFHNQPRAFVEKAARVAERTRAEMQRKWFGSAGEAWQPKCDLLLYGTAVDYSRVTGVPTASPGHSRIESDPGTGRVIGRRMELHLENASLLEAILPHETTHVVLAGQFGPYQVPRWADEGVAVLTEPAAKVEQHRRNLIKAHQDGQLFAVKELMQLQDYPQARRIAAFYAQSVSLVDYLTRLKGPVVFTEFLRDGVRLGYETALRKHYGLQDFGDLQTRWAQEVLPGMNRLAAGARER